MRKVVALCLLGCFLLTGCGENNTEGESTVVNEVINEESIDAQEESTHIDGMRKIDMPDAGSILQTLTPEGDSANIMFSGVAGESVYHVASIHSGVDNNKCVQYCVLKLEAPYENWECYQINVDEWGVGEECLPTYYDIKPYVSEDGNLHMVLMGQEALYLCQWNEDAGASGRMINIESEINELFEHGVDAWYEDDNGELYVAVGKEFYCFDESFAEKTITDTAPDGYVYQIIQNPFSQELYFMGASADSVVEKGMITEIEDGGFSVWKTENKEAIYVADITEDTSMQELGAYMCDADCVVFSSATEGFLCNTAGVWQFSLDKSGRTRIYDYEANGIASTDSDRPDNIWASYKTDGYLLILTYTLGEEYLLHELKINSNNQSTGEVENNRNQSSDKEVVQVALTVENEFLKQVIVDYNKQSEQYKVVMRTPGVNEDWNDYRTRIQAEISGGKGPALIENAVLDIEAAAKQGYLENLTEKFADYEDVMMPSAWSIGQVEGQCYGIAYTCSIRTLVGSSDLIGERKNWSMEEAMQCARESGVEAFMFNYSDSPTSLFYNMGLATGTNKNLIDWENKACYFNSEEAIELLEFSQKYADVNQENEDEYERIKKGKLLTTVVYLTSPNEMQRTASLLNGKEVYVGFPVEDNGSGHMIYGSVLSVNQFASSKEGATDFLRYLLSEEVQKRLVNEYEQSRYGYGFPVRNDSMEKVYDLLRSKSEEEQDELLHGMEEQWNPLTDEQIDVLREIFETARPGIGDSASAVFDVVEEELPVYFSGEKTAKEVMDIAQNRAQLYMDENQ